ncbi:MAG: hypothetical protein NTX94_05445 [Caldiserica bacterium]|nr:hypothetical protein [Caldisericota bacterium]
MSAVSEMPASNGRRIERAQFLKGREEVQFAAPYRATIRRKLSRHVVESPADQAHGGLDRQQVAYDSLENGLPEKVSALRVEKHTVQEACALRISTTEKGF